ncbi:hypothetical protein HMPREF0061_0224 [Aerococcus viridans ATCC 11563 = CCUG 4311]|uniref:Holin-like toxin n=1 Tax=Aerococcus viridans (strain ATCC 11563 / DSM 20340 / CCUG 4311 / JCM 20461 / NBRC 12219 / NCTC 8251 / M1) TaxID=655812 RepID=A0ABP2I8X1_AERVM|nr:hypothetical protein HMPREF0061_0224 [Aerococcus viridans ATCC 11563 = CCUG 4311]
MLIIKEDMKFILEIALLNLLFLIQLILVTFQIAKKQLRL